MEFAKAVNLGEREKLEIPRGWGKGFFKEPHGMEIPGRWGWVVQKPSVGGGGRVDIFWNHTFFQDFMASKTLAMSTKASKR